MNTVAKWAGPALSSCQPDEVLAILNGLKTKNGGLSPSAVVDAASDPRHPLHDAFEWDDSKAAKSYRLEQAQSLIRSIRIVRQDAPNVSYRAYSIHRQESADDSGRIKGVYMSTDQMLADPETRLELLQRALNELKAFRRKWAGLNELVAVLDAAERSLMGR